VTARPRLPDVRPLDRFRSIRTKLGVLVASTVSVSALVVWAGLNLGLGPVYTVPGAVLAALAVTQVLARGMTSPLREMTAAARAMATGDYSRRVRASSRDEVGELAHAFNRMAEDLASVDQQRRDLVANVSHALWTPVAALRAQLENLVDGVTPADPRTLAALLAHTERLSRLVTELLELSRLEAGVVPLRLTTVDVASFLDDAVGAARLVAEDDGRFLRWAVEVAPAGLTVRADAERLHQVVANLLDNAVRHSPAGGLIRVSAARQGVNGAATGPPAVVLDVADEGPGIAPEHRQSVFERFHRGGSSGTDGGTGLGLAIARWAVGLHGGTIEVADAPVGCRIRVLLPPGPDSRGG
jgi:signal transduction histidine kinase